MTGYRTRTRATAAAMAAVAALAVLPGCAGARNSLGTSASPCFRALPPAKDAVNRKGKLIGVRVLSSAVLKKRIPGDQKLAAVTAKDLCVFAFHGTFQAADVPLATIKRSGSYAVVALTIRHPAVVAAFILDHPPARFSHLR